jgi:hypothetical protein
METLKVAEKFGRLTAIATSADDFVQIRRITCIARETRSWTFTERQHRMRANGTSTAEPQRR